jgi:hypothetical protein
MQSDLSTAEECVRIAEEYLRHAEELLLAHKNYFWLINLPLSGQNDNIYRLDLLHEQDNPAPDIDVDEATYVGNVVRLYKPQLVEIIVRLLSYFQNPLMHILIAAQQNRKLTSG